MARKSSPSRKRKEAEIVTVAEGPIFKKSESTAVRINIIAVNGEEMFDLRQYYRTRDSDEWLPTPKGFTLPIDGALTALRRFVKFVKVETDVA